jgi:GntR family transcriptional regulator / MocR family aminotransferase
MVRKRGPVEGQKRQPISRVSPILDLPITLERDQPTSLHDQLTQVLRAAITDGKLETGSSLPPSRLLARTLGVTRHTVVEAFETLRSEGLIEARQGSGTVVASRAETNTSSPSRWAQAAHPNPSTITHDFSLERIAVPALPQDVWRRAWRETTKLLPSSQPGDPRGNPELCMQIAHYLRRTRAINATPEQIIITSGTSAALRLLWHSLPLENQTVICEEPGYALARSLTLERHAKTHFAQVDLQGIQPDTLPAALLAHVTPSHQYPSGGVLGLERRHGLLAWAARHDSLIIENDYGGEFRYGIAPQPTMFQLDSGGRVAYVGTFSLLLSPALRIGYVIAPQALLEPMTRTLERWGERVSAPLEESVSWLMASGELERHLRRCRREYTHRREVLLEMLHPLETDFSLHGTNAGLHIWLEPHEKRALKPIFETLLQSGLRVANINEYCARTPSVFGLLLNFGALEVAELRDGIQLLISNLSLNSDQSN